MNRYVASAAVVAGSLLLSAAPTAASPPSPAGAVSVADSHGTGTCDRCSSGDLADGGLIARTRWQMDQLSQGYGGNPAPDCNDEHYFVPEDGNDIVEYEGWLRWVPDFANDPTPPEGESNEWYRQICYLPGMPTRDGEPEGASWLRFDAVDPENLALVAIDTAVAGIPQLTIGRSPEGDSLVAVDTWFWVAGDARREVTAEASTPFTSVVATARAGGLRIDLGDGATLTCDGPGVVYEAGAETDCKYGYDVAGNYGVEATVLWTGTYTVDGGQPVPIETAVARTATFDLAVEEAQAINTGG